MSELGVLSLVPVILILVIAVTTKRTLFAMACGLTAGVILLAGGPAELIDTWFGYLYTSMSNETLQWLILVVALFGILIALYERSYAVTDFGVWMARYMNTKKKALLGTFILGVIIFLDDYLNNLAVSTTMKGITDRLQVPRTQLAYIVNSTAAPVCVLIPLSTWAVYFGGLLEGQGITGANGTGLGAYIQAIPLVFYGWLAVIVVILQIFGIIPKIGQIKRDTIRAEQTGDVFPLDSDPALVQAALEERTADRPAGSPWAFVVSLGVMIGVTILTDINVMNGALAGVGVIFVWCLLSRRLKFKEILDACYSGVLSMGFVIVLCVLAFAVQAVNTDLQLAEFLIGVTKPIMSGAFLPVVLFILCAVYAYTTGCFWDLAAIIIPIAIPMAQAMDVNVLLAAAAVFSGAAFGSNTCLYGDGVIVCSQGAQIRAVDLMISTLPYALIAGGISAVFYLIAGFVM